MARNRRCVTLLGVALALGLTCLAAQAQNPGGGQGGGGGGPRGGGMMRMMGGMDNSLMLLRSEKVQKELDLLDDQKEQLKALSDKAREEFRTQFTALRDLSPEERDAKIQELLPKLRQRSEELRKKVDEILMPPQLERLKELQLQANLQFRGASALADGGVLKDLGLSDSQKAQLEKIKEKADQSMRALFTGQPAQNQNETAEQRRARFDESRKKRDELNKQLNDEAMAVLTPQQKEKLEKLKGQKFEFDFPQRGPRGGQNPSSSGGAPAKPAESK